MIKEWQRLPSNRNWHVEAISYTRVDSLAKMVGEDLGINVVSSSAIPPPAPFDEGDLIIVPWQQPRDIFGRFRLAYQVGRGGVDMAKRISRPSPQPFGDWKNIN